MVGKFELPGIEKELTEAERLACFAVQDYLFANGGDGTTVRSSSPTGDGRWVPLTEIFPRNAKGNAARQATRRAHEKGALRTFEVAFYGDCVKAVMFEKVSEAEAEAKASH